MSSIWPGAKWAVGSLSFGLSFVTIPAVKNQLQKWKENGTVVMHDDPGILKKFMDSFETTSIAGVFSYGMAYLTAKAVMPMETFPSFFVSGLTYLNLYP